MARPRRPLADRFWEKVDKSGPAPDRAPHLSGCWLWTATGLASGYGLIRVGPPWRSALAHRVAYELARGPIPDGHQVDHLCFVPSCVNPDHLEAVTPRVNQLRSNGVGGVSARKTHCVNGHPLVAPNLYSYNGFRHCRTCVLNRRRAYVARKKECV